MKIELEQVAKRFRQEWVLRNLQLVFESTKQYAITGPNGSGKSTLLKILSGHLTPSRGNIRFSQNGKALEIDAVYKNLSYAAPYIDLIEEFTLEEALRFHGRFKRFRQNMSSKDIIDLLGFKKNRTKPIRHFSSGMKQRLKLALAICSDSSLLLLDEPTTNLDTQGVDWYLQLMENHGRDRLLIIASNVDVDFNFCKEQVHILNYK